MGKTLLLASGKGGTGKTALAAGLSSALAALGASALLVDCDVGLRNADILLGLSERAVLDFGDVLRKRARLDEAIVRHPDLPGLALLSAPLSLDGIEPEAFEALIDELSQKFRFVLCDGPAGLEGALSLAARACSGALVVATPDIISMRDAARTRETLEKAGMSHFRLVVNRVKPRLISKHGACNIDDIIDVTGLRLLGLVPEDERVTIAGNQGIPLVLQTDEGAAQAFFHIANRLLGRDLPLMKIK